MCQSVMGSIGGREKWEGSVEMQIFHEHFTPRTAVHLTCTLSSNLILSGEEKDSICNTALSFKVSELEINL